MVQVWITLSDLQPRFQGRDIIQRQITQKTVQDRAIYNGGQIASRINELSNCAIFNELERPLLPVSRSRHSLTLNISETVRDTDIVSMKYQLGLTAYVTVSPWVTLSGLAKYAMTRSVARFLCDSWVSCCSHFKFYSAVLNICTQGFIPVRYKQESCRYVHVVGPP